MAVIAIQDTRPFLAAKCQSVGGRLGHSRQVLDLAVAAAVAQERADWGVCIEPIARRAGLGFLPLQEEQYDFVIPRSRLVRPAVQAFIRLVQEAATRRKLTELGLLAADD